MDRLTRIERCLSSSFSTLTLYIFEKRGSQRDRSRQKQEERQRDRQTGRERDIQRESADQTVGLTEY